MPSSCVLECSGAIRISGLPIQQTRKRGDPMNAGSAPSPLKRRNPLLVIAVGGFIAGTLDLIQASIFFGWKIPLVIAGGLLGRAAFHGGAGTYIVGVLLHFFIAFSVTAIYYAA